jgi:hypothetical protein
VAFRYSERYFKPRSGQHSTCTSVLECNKSVANVLPETDMEYFDKDGDRMQMMFNFQVNQNLFYALAASDCRQLVQALKATKPRPATAQWGLFLRNHDELISAA